jgi:hypothetical protein
MCADFHQKKRECSACPIQSHGQSLRDRYRRESVQQTGVTVVDNSFAVPGGAYNCGLRRGGLTL